MAAILGQIGPIVSLTKTLVSSLTPSPPPPPPSAKSSKMDWKDGVMITAIAVAVIAGIFFGLLHEYFLLGGTIFFGAASIFGEFHVRKFAILQARPEKGEDVEKMRKELQSVRKSNVEIAEALIELGKMTEKVQQLVETEAGEHQKSSKLFKEQISTLKTQNELLIKCGEDIKGVSDKTSQQFELSRRIHDSTKDQLQQFSKVQCDLAKTKSALSSETKALTNMREIAMRQMQLVSRALCDLKAHTEALPQLRDVQKALLQISDGSTSIVPYGTDKHQ